MRFYKQEKGKTGYLVVETFRNNFGTSIGSWKQWNIVKNNSILISSGYNINFKIGKWFIEKKFKYYL